MTIIHRNHIALALACIGITVMLPGSYYYGKIRAGRVAADHQKSRGAAIKSQASQGRWDVIVVGDSIVELADLSDLCGSRVLNAGVAGARTQDIEPMATEVIAIAKPRAVVIGSGTNDAWSSNTTTSEDFRSTYRSIIAAARKAGAHVYALTPPPLGDGSFETHDLFSPETLRLRQNEVQRIGVPVIDETAPLQRSDGAMDYLYTNDGVHPNAVGYVVWKRTLRNGLPREVCP